MKVSLSWLKELVDIKLSAKKLADQLSLISIGVKEFTDDFLELDLTYNRGDLLSLRGVAREVTAITNSKLLFSTDTSSQGEKLPGTPVKIADVNLSAVQCVAKITGLRVAKSPEAWVKKLADCGMRTVNNIADVTNLIMLEYGQPLHAFDQTRVKDETINVRYANPGETLVTLDGKLRKLESSDIVLADTEKALDVAGIMGGQDTEIKNSTTTILLSASLFNPNLVRKTAQRLALHSEASKRFQHGLTKTSLLQALTAAIKMYEGLGGKLTALALTGDFEDNPKILALSQHKLNSLIGIDIPANQVESSLQSLGFTLASHLSSGGLKWKVTVPYWRLDINIEEDLIEEVARMYGYEKIPAQPLEGAVPEKLDESLQNLIYDLKTALKNAGLTEVQTYSFYSSNIIENLKLEIKNLVKIANPLSSETQYLRQSIWPNLLEVVERNLKHGFSDIAVFEIGKAYYVEKDLPKEEYRLSIVLCNGTDNPLSELYQVVQNVWKILKDVMVTKVDPKNLAANLCHPNRYFELERNGKQIGGLSEIHLKILNKLGIEKRVAIMEVEFS